MTKTSTLLFSLLCLCGSFQETLCFSTRGLTPKNSRIHNGAIKAVVDDIRGSDEWQGDVVPGGKIRGCSVIPVGDEATEWVIRIDGIEADLGRFSEAIYKQIINDAKRQSFQGFRPGTIPPQLLKTYRAFAFDECCRETVLEAMQQNNIRPFSQAREEIRIEQVSIPPPKPKKRKKKKKKKGSSTSDDKATDVPDQSDEAAMESAEPEWQVFESMDKAINAGWAPGQSFSFIATNVKGQKILNDEQTRGSLPLGSTRR